MLGQARLQVLRTMMAGTQRRKSLPVTLGQNGRMLHQVKNNKVIRGQTRSVLLLKAKNKKLIRGQARCLLLQQRKKLTPGVLKGAMGMMGVGTMLARLLGANQVPQVEIKNLLGTSQNMVMIMLDMVGVDLDVGIVAEVGEGLGTVDLHGMEEATQMMDQVEEGLKISGTVGIPMVAEEGVEDALVEVIAIKVTTLDQETEMVAVGALAAEAEAVVVVTETMEMTTMREGPPVKTAVVAGLTLLPGMLIKREVLKKIKLSQLANPAGGVTTMIVGELQNHLVEMIRQERRTETTPGVKTSHLLAMDPLSWVSGLLLLAAPQLVEELLAMGPLSWASGVLLLVTPPLVLEDPQAEEDHGERAMKIAGILQKELEAQKVVRRRKDPGTRPKGAGAKAAVAAVPGTRRPVVDGTATRAGMPAMVVAVSGKLVPESAVPDSGVYIRVSAMHVSAL